MPERLVGGRLLRVLACENLTCHPQRDCVVEPGLGFRVLGFKVIGFRVIGFGVQVLGFFSIYRLLYPRGEYNLRLLWGL